jgi:hypothetical protein
VPLQLVMVLGLLKSIIVLSLRHNLERDVAMRPFFLGIINAITAGFNKSYVI